MAFEKEPNLRTYNPSTDEILAAWITLMRFILPGDQDIALAEDVYPAEEVKNEAKHLQYIARWLANFKETSEGPTHHGDIDQSNSFFNSLFYGLAVGRILLPVESFGESWRTIDRQVQLAVYEGKTKRHKLKELGTIGFDSVIGASSVYESSAPLVEPRVTLAQPAREGFGLGLYVYYLAYQQVPRIMTELEVEEEILRRLNQKDFNEALHEALNEGK